MAKFQRNYKLYVDTSDGDQILIQPPFSIEFDVNRNVLASTNTSSVKIYNLSQETRNSIYKDQIDLTTYRSMKLDAGYGDSLSTIFKGNIKQCYSVREGVNFMTTIEGLDGGFAFLNGNTEVNVPKGTPLNGVLETIIQSLPKVNRGAVGNFTSSSKRSNTFSGNTAELLSELSGGGFFIDLEKCYILGDDECITGSIVVITSDSGLLGTPRREQTAITFDMIFEPRLLIGQLVVLNSSTDQNFNGPRKVISVHHRGMISDSVCGSATTSVGLWYGTSLLRIVGAG